MLLSTASRFTRNVARNNLQRSMFMSTPKLSSRAFNSNSNPSQTKMMQLTLLFGALGFATYTINEVNNGKNGELSIAKCAARPDPKYSGDVIMLEPTKEKATGILFPKMCNAMTFVGCGVRVKYGFVKVYAVGTYMDPIAMAAVKKSGPDGIQKALLDPQYPRTIRIVMNRGLSIEKYTAAIVEALEPRMKGEDMEKLEEFKKMNPAVDLVEGAEMEMTIRGNVMLYQNALGGVGQIESQAFCAALCDVYYGSDPVSPGHKEQVINGVQKL